MTFRKCACGCGNIIPMMDNRGRLRKCALGHHSIGQNLLGLRFGMLVAKKPLGTKNQKRVWLCLCDCGKTTEVLADALKRGTIVSCGCYKKLWGAIHNVVHGDSRVGKIKSLYRTWSGMRSRCREKKNPNYSIYSSRGITVIPKWEDYKIFREWALNNGYTEGLDIHRIDNYRGYFPNNCVFLTRSEHLSIHRRNVA